MLVTFDLAVQAVGSSSKLSLKFADVEALQLQFCSIAVDLSKLLRTHCAMSACDRQEIPVGRASKSCGRSGTRTLGKQRACARCTVVAA